MLYDHRWVRPRRAVPIAARLTLCAFLTTFGMLTSPPPASAGERPAAAQYKFYPHHEPQLRDGRRAPVSNRPSRSIYAGTSLKERRADYRDRPHRARDGPAGVYEPQQGKRRLAGRRVCISVTGDRGCGPSSHESRQPRSSKDRSRSGARPRGATNRPNRTGSGPASSSRNDRTSLRPRWPISVRANRSPSKLSTRKRSDTRTNSSISVSLWLSDRATFLARRSLLKTTLLKDGV